MIQKRTTEEIANTLTHLLGVVAALASVWILIQKGFQNSSIAGISMSVFAGAIFCMYLASTLYHWAMPGKTKSVLRKLDHSNIYILIAASYTPMWLYFMGGTSGWVGFGVMWGIALFGIIYKIVAMGKYPKLSLAIYLLMGWSIVFVVKPIWLGMTAEALWFLLLEAIFYTVGTYFYAHSEKPYFHAIWHLFVIGGTFSHFMCMLAIL